MKKALLGTGIVLLILVIMSASGVASAVNDAQATQAATEASLQAVKIKMADGLEIKGNFYASGGDATGPAVLLLHQNEGDRWQWATLIPSLTKHGYNVLTVDQRGFGATGGTRVYMTNVSDATALVTWLRAQPSVDPDRVAFIGASVGANIAIRACAADEKCRAIIALSPGMNFFGVSTQDAVKVMKNKAILLIAGQLDLQSADAVKALIFAVPNTSTAMVKVYGGASNHGKDLLTFSDLSPTILQWLEQYNN